MTGTQAGAGMPYDYQLVAGVFVMALSLVAVANAMVDRRSPLAGFVGVLAGLGLLVWAWMMADGGLGVTDVPEAIFRIIASWR